MEGPWSGSLTLTGWFLELDILSALVVVSDRAPCYIL